MLAFKIELMISLRTVLKIRDTGRNVLQKVDRSSIFILLFPFFLHHIAYLYLLMLFSIKYELKEVLL